MINKQYAECFPIFLLVFIFYLCIILVDGHATDSTARKNNNNNNNYDDDAAAHTLRHMKYFWVIVASYQSNPKTFQTMHKTMIGCI